MDYETGKNLERLDLAIGQLKEKVEDLEKALKEIPTAKKGTL